MGDGVLSRGNYGLEEWTCGCAYLACSDLPRLLVAQRILEKARIN
jgi:hypothetical protein